MNGFAPDNCGKRQLGNNLYILQIFVTKKYTVNVDLKVICFFLCLIWQSRDEEMFACVASTCFTVEPRFFEPSGEAKNTVVRNIGSSK